MERQSKVLVVDDDPFALQSMAKVLDGESYQVVTAASGSEALDLLKQDTFDLVLTDLKMPGVDGLEVLKQAREIAPQAVVLILTGYASLESAVEALREGAYDYLLKPCSSDELRLKIERGLERVRLVEERERAHEETRQHAREQETVSRITYALNTPDVREAFPILVEGLQDLTRCDAVSLIVLDEAGEQFIMSILEPPFPLSAPPNGSTEPSGRASSRGFAEVFERHGEWEGEAIPFSATAAAEDVEAGRPHLTADLSTETHFPFEQALYQAGLRSWVTLPLLVGGEVFGALGLGGSDTGLFWEDQLPILRQIADAVAFTLENSFFFQAEREQRELAEALEAAAAAVSSTLDPDQLLDRILEQVSRVVPNDATNIMLIEGDRARVVRWRGYERFGAEEFVPTIVFRIPEVPNLQQMLGSREPVVIPDTITYPGWVHMPVQEWLRSYAAAPIIVRGEVIGFLNVDSATPGFFTHAHAETLRAFADHAAAAIENARLYEVEQERRHIAETLRQASAVLSSTLELDEVLELILGQLRQAIPYDSASVQQLLNGRLKIVACQGFEEPDRVVGLVFPLDPKFPNQRVVATKSPLAIEDVTQDYPHFQDEADTYESGRIRSWLGVPLMAKGQVIGMVAVDRVEVRPYTAEEVQLAMAFANQAGLAIENARLFEEEKRGAAQLALINEVGEKAASILDLDKLMQEVTRRIQESFNYYNVALLLLDEERREVVMQAIVGGFEHVVPGEYRQSIDEGIIGFVAKTGQSRLVSDVSKDPHYVKGFLGEVLTKSELCVPIKLSDRVIGALDVQSIHLNAFDQSEVVVLEAVADRVAIAMENARLFEDTERLKAFNESIVQGVAEAILIEDVHGTLTFANPAAEELLGYTREELTGQHWTIIVPEEQVEKVRQETAKRPQGIESRYEMILLSKEGRSIPVIVGARPLFEEGKFVGVLSAFTDITAQKRMEETLRALLLIDDLTGLYNRRGFVTLSQHQLKAANRARRRMLLLFADFDGLKRINDTFGHPEGDRALIEVADVLRETFRESDIVARIGGDEFVVLAIETDRFSSEVLTTRLQEKLEARNARGDRRYKLSLSVGLARYDSEHPCSIDELLAQADRAMYEKKQGDGVIAGCTV